MSVLKTEGATMRFGGVTAVDNLNIHIENNEIVAIIGPNGAGKTTAFNMITGVYKPTSGQVLYQKPNSGNAAMENITGKRPDLIAGLGIARTFQNIRLFKEQSVLDNVLIANHVRLKNGFFSAMLHWPFYYKSEREMRERSMVLLESVGLADHANELATSLPYGLQRRLEIARALATQPQLLLLDEPAAGMNPKETEDLTQFVAQIRDDFQLTVLLIEHHMQIVMDISDRIYVLDYGKTIAHGSPAEIQGNPDVITAYLGVEEE
ncbi:ABC transporter ATP-binding protein [Eubacteriales bacterium OttesenSCG-928-K08]|nr:ABC transporter ATP-binding protein [Eubacteriales bacterium OttesenSCG-928-K08]